LISKIEAPCLMASLAITKILNAEGALVVMASQATLCSRRGMMHQWLWRGDLSSLRHACPDVMTVITTKPLTRVVLRMTEIHTVGNRLC
jgi:hypothetical protein